MRAVLVLLFLCTFCIIAESSRTATKRGGVFEYCDNCEFTLSPAYATIDFSSNFGTSVSLPISGDDLKDNGSEYSFTFEAWVQTTNNATGARQSIVSRYPFDQPTIVDDQVEFNLYLNEVGNLMLYLSAGVGMNPSLHLGQQCGSITSNQWNFVTMTLVKIPSVSGVFTYSTSYEVFLGGVSQCSGTFNSAFQTLDGFILSGMSYDQFASVEYWDGNIDEVRLWKGIRTSEQIMSSQFYLQEPQPTLLAYYGFDDASPSPVDKSGNNHPALIAPYNFVTVGSTAPLINYVPQQAQQMAVIPFFVWSSSASESYEIVITKLPEQGAFYYDASGLDEYLPNNDYLVSQGGDVLILYYYSETAVNDTISYHIVSHQQAGEIRLVQSSDADIIIGPFSDDGGSDNATTCETWRGLDTLALDRVILTTANDQLAILLGNLRSDLLSIRRDMYEGLTTTLTSADLAQFTQLTANFAATLDQAPAPAPA
eukprot:TRINITY_DN1032_c0_g1_i1.p1 TRINITY_DN1032_c0_g1~~TRINITY_DN1032_c0_g1_i1.p1  ORF type:complete len:482 (+),score=59.52 TRINITY_DN1032_c0_g1_i1:123-1568(+)